MDKLAGVPFYKIKMIEPIKLISREERIKRIEEAGLNVFLLHSKDIFIDLLSDSGTNAMSQNQWSAMFQGDEAYSGCESFYRLKKAVKDVLGFDFVLPTHQGRGAEKVLDAALIKEGDIVPGNYHFDTTQAHIEFRKAQGINCVIDEAFNTSKEHPFKGNTDLEKLEKVLKENKGKVPYVIITITCNSIGGQPVSMENIRKTKELCRKYNVPLFFDAARFSENAFFIKKREKGYTNKSIGEIVLEMMSFADGITCSAKKDALVNIGGFLAFRKKELFEKCVPFNVLFEGFPTYGGLSGRDLEAVAVGLREAIKEEFLAARTAQVKYLGEELIKAGIPIQIPIGGHAVFVDGKKFLAHIPQEQFPSHSLANELYIEGGIRGVEIGTLLAGRDPKTGKNILPKLDLFRMAIPRRVYLKEHFDYIAECFKELKKRKDEIKGLQFEFESPILRHFQSRFKRVE